MVLVNAFWRKSALIQVVFCIVLARGQAHEHVFGLIVFLFGLAGSSSAEVGTGPELKSPFQTKRISAQKLHAGLFGKVYLKSNFI